jgi:hypothetical protein
MVDVVEGPERKLSVDPGVFAVPLCGQAGAVGAGAGGVVGVGVGVGVGEGVPLTGVGAETYCAET